MTEATRTGEWRGASYAFATCVVDDAHTLCLSLDGRKLVLATADPTLSLFDTSTGEQRMTLSGHSQPVHALAFSPDGLSIPLSGSHDEKLKLWDAKSGHLVRTLKGHTGR